MKCLVTGANGFLGGYLVAELLRAGWDVVGLDDFSKYGRVNRSYDQDPRYQLVKGDARNGELLRALLADCDHFVMMAAVVGGIGYANQRPYAMLADNDRITAAGVEAALHARAEHKLQKVTLISSPRVFEAAQRFPTSEGSEWNSPPPRSPHGFQKLAAERHVRAAQSQHGLPFTIVRPCDGVGIGEGRALEAAEVSSGALRFAPSHVVPDLARKVLLGQDPLRILGEGNQTRHFTWAGDLARGIRAALEHPAARNQDFNLAHAAGTTVLELGQRIWRRVHGDGRPFRYVSEPACEYDVVMRRPDVTKARRVLGFEARTTLDPMLEEVLPWISAQLDRGAL